MFDDLNGALSENQETILTANTNDQATPDDGLGFSPYVNAVADFLTNKDTHPPLVLSIEGEWGSGKTSFMLQLQKALRERGQRFTVWFNPWRHDKEDALWAAFALEFIRVIAERQSFFRRWTGHLRLFARRFQWKDGWLSLVQKIAVWVLIIIVTVGSGIVAYMNRLTWTTDLADLAGKVLNIKEGADVLSGAIGAGGTAAYLALLFTILTRIRNILGNPLSIDLKKYMQTPNYEERVSFVERFHEDFEHILEAYAGDETVYVFIDDVDRCEVPKAADLMSALNLMITGNTHLIFIIGMDREKVAAGLAVKHEKLLPYMSASRYGVSDDAGKFQPSVGLEYGYEFIEKFVQLPFLLPKPDDAALEKFLSELSHPVNKSADRAGSVTAQRGLARLFRRAEPNQPVAKVEPFHEESSTTDADAPDLSARQSVIVQLGVDSPHIHAIVRLVAPAFDNNPRRIKQYINLFRLRVFIAAATGLFDQKADDQRPALTLEQLGKFVAVILHWPILLAEMESMPDLLSTLQKLAVDPSQTEDPSKLSPIVRRWTRRSDLMNFLSSGVTKNTVETSEWSLTGVNVPLLLQVLPQVRKVGVPVRQPTFQSAAQTSSFAEAGNAPLTQTMSTYIIGDDLFDESFSIETPQGEFLGEYGIGITDTIGIGNPKKPLGFEAWLFDKTDIRTSTKLMVSPYAINDSEIRQRLEPKGEIQVAKPGEQYLLDNQNLQLLVTIVDIQYGTDKKFPPESYFERITFECAVWQKKSLGNSALK